MDFLNYIYGLFGFNYELKLSTRPAPDKRLGEDALWDSAEKALEDALNEFKKITGKSFEIDPGEGAFYGPKIDIKVFDALRRDHQCGTI